MGTAAVTNATGSGMQSGDWAWLGLIVVALGVDAVFLKTHQELLTTSARRHKIVAFTLLGVFALHVLDVLGPADPFRALGHLVP